MNRSIFFGSIHRRPPSRAVLALVALLTPALPLIADIPPNAIAIGESDDFVTIVRCHFNEDRIVIRHGDRLHVLHKGDQIEAMGLTVVDISTDSATITVRQSPPKDALRIFQVSQPTKETIHLREYSTDPSALGAATRFPPENPVGVRTSNPQGTEDLKD